MCVKTCLCNHCHKKETCTDCVYFCGWDVKVDCMINGVMFCKDLEKV